MLILFELSNQRLHASHCKKYKKKRNWEEGALVIAYTNCKGLFFRDVRTHCPTENRMVSRKWKFRLTATVGEGLDIYLCSLVVLRLIHKQCKDSVKTWNAYCHLNIKSSFRKTVSGFPYLKSSVDVVWRWEWEKGSARCLANVRHWRSIDLEQANVSFHQMKIWWRSSQTV